IRASSQPVSGRESSTARIADKPSLVLRPGSLIVTLAVRHPGPAESQTAFPIARTPAQLTQQVAPRICPGAVIRCPENYLVGGGQCPRSRTRDLLAHSLSHGRVPPFTTSSSKPTWLEISGPRQGCGIRDAFEWQPWPVTRRPRTLESGWHSAGGGVLWRPDGGTLPDGGDRSATV